MLLFTKSGVSVFGAGSSHAPEPDAVDIIFDLAGRYSMWSLPSQWKSASLAAAPLVVDMHIPDMTAPTWVSKEFWTTLWKDLKGEAVKRGGKLSVLVTCFGGHGRTGTVLAALALAANAVPKKTDPIAWLRDSYCDNAIETAAQLSYILSLFGITTEEIPSKTTSVKVWPPKSGSASPGSPPWLDDLYAGIE